MKEKIFILVLPLLLTLLAGGLNETSACSCNQTAPVCEAFGGARAVFVGEVVEGRSAERMSEMTTAKTPDNGFVFKVRQNFLGTEEGKNVTINTGFGGGDCGFPFQKGETYLVYAYGDALSTGICTRTRHVSRAGDDFEDLKYLLLTSGGKISGTVDHYAKSSFEKDFRQPMANLKLRVVQTDGAQKQFETRTNETGKFQLTGLPTGKYRIEPLLAAGLDVSSYATDEFLLNDKGCSTRNFTVENDSLVEVKVVDPDGKPVTNIWVEFIPVGIKTKTVRLPREFSVTNPQGEIFKYSIPPGRYTVSVNYFNTPDREEPFPATFYPNVTERGKAKVIDVGVGTQLRNLVIRIPYRLKERPITGSAVWDDGTPVAGGNVSLEDTVTGDVCVVDCFETDANGNFTVYGYEGRNYKIHLRADKKISDTEQSFTVESKPFALGADAPNIKLILETKR